jgi:diguanylate cyclase (GGDEF)-like protein
VSPWPQAVEAAKARRCTGLAAIKAYDIWRENFLFSDPMRSTYMYIFTRADSPVQVDKISQLDGKKVAYLRSEAGAEVLLKRHTRISGVPVESNEDAFAVLQSGQVDAVFGSISMELLRRDSGLFGLKLAALIPESRTKLVIAVRKDWPELVVILNKALASLTADEKNRLEERWFGETASRLLASDNGIDLTEAEMDWLAAGRVVRVRVSDAPPYMLTQPVPSGISVDTLNAVAKRLGFRVEYKVDTLGWMASYDDLRGERRHYDLFPAMTRTPERERDFALTRDYLSTPWVIFTRNDTPYVNGLNALKGKTVVAEKGFAITERLKAEYPELNILEVPSREDALQALVTRQADAYVGNLANANYLIKERQLSNLMVAAPAPFGDNKQGMAVRKDWAVLAGLIDKGMAAMPAEERAAIQEKWGTVEFKPQVDYTLVAWVGAVSCGIVLLVIFLSKRRAKGLHKLAFNDALTQLPNRRALKERLKLALASSKRMNSHGALLFLDLNKFKLLNDTHGHDIGDLLLIEVAHRLKQVTRGADMVARLGGDEFLVLLEGLGPDAGKAAEHADVSAEKVRQALSEEYVFDDIHHSGSASIGIKLFLGDALDSDQIIKEADAAMYEAKRSRSR